MESRERKIMIVEDEGLIAADLQGRLERAGYTVPPIADSAEEALRIIRETQPDLVLMDIRIKGEVDGIDVAQQVRSELDVPVIYLTAYEDQGTLERASHTQAFGYIKKPIASASLKGSIEMALSKHQHERYLREQRDWFSANFAAVPHGVLVTDGTGRLCYLNNVAEELTGWRADEGLGQPLTRILRLFYRSTGQRVEDLVPAALLQAQPMPLPRDICLRDRKERSYDVEGSIAPKWREGRMDGTFIQLKDVTVSRFEEEHSKQDEKQGALIRMAGEIAQRLDSGLGVVAEESARLLDALSMDNALRESAETIERAALDAFAVTCRLQAFARPPEMRMETIRLNDLLGRLEGAWQRILPGFALRLDPDPRPVQADPWQLTRALVSILLHASKAGRDGGGVTLEVTRPDRAAIGDWICIRVRYAPAGEDMACLERVFEPTWSMESEGLPLAYRRIREMGGLFHAQLDRSGMVRFEIFLPQAEIAAAGVPLPENPEPAILLIEPNPEVRRVLQKHFEQHGYTLLETDTCEEALLLAHLYQGAIPLAIAHPAKGDWARAKISESLATLKPGIRVKLLAGYWQECGSPGSEAWESTCRYLTKWDLLEWANHAIVSARGASGAPGC